MEDSPLRGSMSSSPSPVSTSPTLYQTHVHQRTMSTSARFISISTSFQRSPPSTPPRRGDRIVSPQSAYRLINESPTNAALLRRTRQRKSAQRWRDRLKYWIERQTTTCHQRTRIYLVILCTLALGALGYFQVVADESSSLFRIAAKTRSSGWSQSSAAVATSALVDHDSNMEEYRVKGLGTGEAFDDGDEVAEDDSGPQSVEVPARPPVDMNAELSMAKPGRADSSPIVQDHDTVDEVAELSLSGSASPGDGDAITEDNLEQQLEAVVAAAAIAAASSPGPSDERPFPSLPKSSSVNDGRKFIFVAWMGEQETKAQFHLYQLGLLAVALNRTLVLPQVRRSRFTTCYKSPFALYYAPDSLDRFHIPWISHADFLAYTHRDEDNQKGEAAPRTGQLIAMVRGKQVSADMAILPLNDLCLAAVGLELEAYAPKAFFRPFSEWKDTNESSKFAKSIIQSLSEPDPNTGTTPDVLVFQYNLRYPLLSPEIIRQFQPPGSAAIPHYQYFQYSPHWTHLGEQMAKNLAPFIAVHWRTETLEVKRISPCGSALIGRIKEVKEKRPDLSTVYLAMDYPIEHWFNSDHDQSMSVITAHSGTMTKTLTPGHHEAFREFLKEWMKEFGSGKNRIKLTTFMQEQKKVELSDDLKVMLEGKKKGSSRHSKLEEIDGAIVGIVDKNVLAKAEVFIAGAPHDTSHKWYRHCAKESQFTEQIIDGRQRTLKLQGVMPSTWSSLVLDRPTGSLWNSVEYFRKPGKKGAKRSLREDTMSENDNDDGAIVSEDMNASSS